MLTSPEGSAAIGLQGPTKEARSGARRDAIMRVGTKLTVSLGVVIVAVMAAHEYSVLRETVTVAGGEMRRELRVLTRTMQLAMEGALRRGELRDTQRMVDGIGGYSKVALVAMFDAQGRRAAVTQGQEDLAEKTIPRSAVEQALATGHPVDAASPGLEREYYYYVGPLRGPQGELVGAFAVVQDLDWIWDKVIRRTARTALETLLLIGIGGGLVWILSWRHVSKPIAALAMAVKEFGEGRFKPAVAGGGDEIGELGREFNRMALRLEEARRKLVDEHERTLKLERELHRSQRLAAIGKIASGLAHDIATPLSVIKGRAELILAKTSDGALRENLRSVVAQIERIERTVRSLLDMAPGQSKSRATDVNAVARAVAELVSEEAKARGVTIECDLAADMKPVMLDPDQLQQVLLNLLVNSLQATPSGGRARLCTRWPADGRNRLTIVVEDDGRGIDPRDLPQIFEPFFTTKGRKGGTGLGLAITREIVEGFGGEISAESEGEGRGAKFTIELPVGEQ